MDNREKIINGFEIILHGCDDIQCKDCEFHIKTPATPARCGLDEEQIKEAALTLLKEQEDFGTELTNAVELIHKKNERIKKLEEQIETLTKWRANAGAFD